MDFETTHQHQPILCDICDEYKIKSFSQKQKEKFTSICIRDNHPKPSTHLCDGCKKEYQSLVMSSKCTHNKIRFTRDTIKQEFSMCVNCHNEVLSRVVCTHSTTECLTALLPISYNFRSVFFKKQSTDILYLGLLIIMHKEVEKHGLTKLTQQPKLSPQKQ